MVRIIIKNMKFCQNAYQVSWLISTSNLLPSGVSFPWHLYGSSFCANTIYL